MQPDVQEMSVPKFEDLDFKKQRRETLTAQDAIVGSAFEMTHEPIYARLQSGTGLHAQFIESTIAEKVMLDFLEQGVVVLPIHDSFLWRLGFTNDLRGPMQQNFKAVTGLDTDIIKEDNSFGMTDDADIYSLAATGAEWLEYEDSVASFVY